MKIKWGVLALSFIIVAIVALVGSNFTVIDSWYNSQKPSIAPPGTVIGIVWTVLYILIALSIYFSWAQSSKKQKKTLSNLFALNLILNMLWSFFFFYLRNPPLALFDLILMWLSILFLIIFTRKFSKAAFYLLIPYIAWVTFAGYLNFLFI